MKERDYLWAMVQRCKALGDRNTETICKCINTRTNLGNLDRLFTLGERQHALYMRIYRRYDATLPLEYRMFKS